MSWAKKKEAGLHGAPFGRKAPFFSLPIPCGNDK